MTGPEWVRKKAELKNSGWKEETDPAKFVREYKSKPDKYVTKTVLDHINKIKP